MKLVVLLTLSILAACGFSPVYYQGSEANISSASQLSSIEVGIIPNKEGVDLRNALIDKLYVEGQGQGKEYLLDVSPISFSVREIGLARDSTATREQITAEANIRFISKKTEALVFQRLYRSVTSYNILESEYATTISRQDARERAIRQIADDIVTSLSLYLKDNAEL